MSSDSGFSSDERSPGSVPSAVAFTARRTIFAERVFGSASTKNTRSGLNALPSSAGDVRGDVRFRRLRARQQAGEDPRRLALDLVRHADRRRLAHGGVPDRGGLELGGADALAGDVQRVVGAAVQEPEAVGVDGGPVAVHPHAGNARPVRLDELVRVAPEAARHAGERLAADELADLAGADERRARRRRRRPSPSRAPGRRPSTP